MHATLLYFPLAAQLLIGLYFTFFGFWNIYHWSPLLAIMAKKDIRHPYLLLPIGICWQITLGFLIIFGIYMKLAALLLIPFTLVAVVIFHPFWKHTGELRALNFSIFMANMTIGIGALLLLISFPAG